MFSPHGRLDSDVLVGEDAVINVMGLGTPVPPPRL
jgi:hypothetical protein